MLSLVVQEMGTDYRRNSETLIVCPSDVGHHHFMSSSLYMSEHQHTHVLCDALFEMNSLSYELTVCESTLIAILIIQRLSIVKHYV